MVVDWKLIPYREAWERQKKLFADLIEKPDGEEHIILAEHPHVYTLGFHGNEANMLADEARLRSLGAECIRIERGGDVTYHGPGQLVVYPIINLHRHKLGVKSYIELLERAVIELLSIYNITGVTVPGAVGVWIEPDTPSARKICAIGVKISHGITMHGLALNVNTDLSAFSLINPCGFVDKGVTSMKCELGRELDLEIIKLQFSKILLTKLNRI